MFNTLERLTPGQAGALWIGFLVSFLVLGDHARLLGRRNVALMGLLSIAPFLYDVLQTGPVVLAWSFRAIFVLTGLMALWAVRLSRDGWANWQPNVPVAALRVLALAMGVLTTAAVLTRPPDDAGIYSNLGAQRWTETGQLPYGDELLKGPDAPAFGAAATYGPILYAVHLPFQLILGTRGNDPSADPMSPDYRWPATAATQLPAWILFLMGVWAFFVVVRRYTGSHMAWAATTILLSLPYFVGMGGEEYVIGGLRYISHIGPMAVTLLAFALLDRPLWAGVLLAAAAGMLFYPAFFFPIWLAWYFFRGSGAGRFGLGFCGAGLALVLLVVLNTQVQPGESAVRLFLESTLEHQEGTGPREYGASVLSFWAYQPTLSRIFQTPLVGDSSLFKLSFVLFAGLCISLSVLSKNRSAVQLAALTSAAAAAVQLWKTNATGSYVEWYLPFLMIALLGQTRTGSEALTAVERETLESADHQVSS